MPTFVITEQGPFSYLSHGSATLLEGDNPDVIRSDLHIIDLFSRVQEFPGHPDLAIAICDIVFLHTEPKLVLCLVEAVIVFHFLRSAGPPFDWVA